MTSTTPSAWQTSGKLGKATVDPPGENEDNSGNKKETT